MESKIDRLLQKAISRKLLTFLFGTVFIILSATGVFTLQMTFDQWIDLAIVYITAQSAKDVMVEVLKARSNK